MTGYRRQLNAEIYKINKELRLQTQNALKQYEITADQWIVLGRVYHAEEKMTQKELARVCFKESAAITRMIDIMQKKGWLERLDAPNDRRAYLISITDKGKQLYEQSSKEVDKLEKFVDSEFTKGEFKELMGYLQRLETALRSWK